MKISRTIEILIIVSLGVLIVISAYGFLFTKIKNKNTATSIITNQFDLEVKKNQRLRSIKQLTKRLEDQFTTLDSYFISDDEIVEFLEQLEDVGRVAGVDVEVNSVSVDGNENLPIENLQIEFVSLGSWESITHLLSLIETMPFSIMINRMQIEYLTVSNNESLWQINIKFSTSKLK